VQPASQVEPSFDLALAQPAGERLGGAVSIEASVQLERLAQRLDDCSSTVRCGRRNSGNL